MNMLYTLTDNNQKIGLFKSDIFRTIFLIFNIHVYAIKLKKLLTQFQVRKEEDHQSQEGI